jgi:hypothetical protein
MDVWFTDGSGINDSFGACIYGPLYNYRNIIRMGILSTEFLTEVLAILSCAEFLLVKNITMRRIHICFL